jgi:tRNA G26 N,N-dimethylase Trm1
MASAKAVAIEVTYVGQTPVLTDASWAEYQIRATGTAVEDVFRVTENGVTRDVMVDAVTHPYLVEAKFGDMGQMWNLEREAHVMQQAANYLKIMDAWGMRGVRYAVSTELGAQRAAVAIYTGLCRGGCIGEAECVVGSLGAS